MAAGGSTKVVVYALVANFGLAVAKLVAALFTNSGAMLAESIHSFADSANQALLLVGAKRAKRAPDETHPLGYGRESYFWGLLVAVFLFTLGGLFSLNEGWHKFNDPHELKSPMVAVAVLVFGIFLEGFSLWAAWVECKRVRGKQSLMEWSRETGDVNLLIVTFEDLAAMAGLVIALVAIVAAAVTGNPLLDAIGTLVIGVLLLIVAVYLGVQVKRLIAGSTAGPAVTSKVTETWAAHGFEVLRIIAVWSGPGKALLACKVRSKEPGGDVASVVERVNAGEAAVRAAVPTVGFQFTELDSVA